MCPVPNCMEGTLTMRELTVKEVAAIATKPGTWRVSKNLYVQVSDTRTKAWLFRYMRNGRSHGMGLGSLDLVTLAEAREKALLCRKMLLDGKDPLEERRKRARAGAAGGHRNHDLPRVRQALYRSARQGLEATASIASSGATPSRPMLIR